jgi:hypothetical protein
MSDADQRIYEELADRLDRKDEARERDNFLALAAEAAFRAGRLDDAERLRRRLLQLSPHNLLRPYPSLAEALGSRDIQEYLADLRRQFPPDQAERLLASRQAAPGVAAEPAIFKLQEPLPNRAPRRGPSSTASPYEAPPSVNVPADDSEVAGRGIAILLFLVVLAVALGLTWWVLLRPLWTG